jgi:hypothetical protein
MLPLARDKKRKYEDVQDPRLFTTLVEGLGTRPRPRPSVYYCRCTYVDVVLVVVVVFVVLLPLPNQPNLLGWRRIVSLRP